MTKTPTVSAALTYAARYIGTLGGRIYWAALKPEWSGAPYCAAFVQYVLQEVGLDWKPALPYYVPSYEAKAKAEGRWLPKSATPRPGDLVVYGYTSGQHIGFVERALSGGFIQTIEGNTSSGTSGSQSNGNGTYRRTRSRAWVRGFIRLPYAEATPAGRYLSEDGIGDAATWRVVQRWLGVDDDGIPGPITLGALQARVGRRSTGRWTQADSDALARLVGEPDLIGRPWSWAYMTKPTRHMRAIEAYLNRAIRRGRFTA